MNPPDGDAALLREGWERRFVAAPPRLDEAVALFEARGFEVRLEPVARDELPDACGDCTLALAVSRAIYVRRRA